MIANEIKTKFSRDQYLALHREINAELKLYFFGKCVYIVSERTLRSTHPNGQPLYALPCDVFDDQTIPIGELVTFSLQQIKSHLERYGNILDSRADMFDADDIRELLRIHIELVQTQYSHLSDLISFLIRCRSKDIHNPSFALLLANNGHLPQREILSTEDYKSPDLLFTRTNRDVPARTTEAHWAKYREWCFQSNTSFCSSYYCETVWDVCYAALDYLAAQGYTLRQCQRCGQYFIPERDGREKYCTMRCANAMIVSKMSTKRNSPLYREIEAIQRMLAARSSKIESSLVGKNYADSKQLHAVKDTRKEFKHLVEDKQAELAAGIVTEDDALAFFIDYHNQLKDQLKEQRKHTH